jgi:glycosyltransferase involved in cell wall biosynthesis
MKILRFPIGLQMVTASEALNKLGYNSTSVQFTDHKFGFRPDACLYLEKYSKEIINKKINDFLIAASQQYDVFHYHDMVNGKYTPTEIQMNTLKKTKKPLIIQHHGSEVRRLSMARAQKNPYVQVKKFWENEENIINRLSKWSRIFDHAIVADHELYHYVKDYYKNIYIIRQPLDLSKYTPIYPDPNKTRPLIVHAPSNKGVKGTEYVLNAVKSLKLSGYHFDFKLVEDSTHDQAIKEYSKADIIIDQLCIGSYGMLSIEGMALGKPVICFIRRDLVKTYPNHLPIINANPDNIKEVLSKLILSHTLRHTIGINSRRYVETNHDSIKIARQQADLYKKLMKY